jgi:hypothetical protein
MIVLKFEGIDSWNRPVFKDVNSTCRYGSLDKLCGAADVHEVVSKITVLDLCYFGSFFDCEPLGASIKVAGDFVIE